MSYNWKIAGIVVGVIVALAVVILGLCWYRRRRMAAAALTFPMITTQNR